MVRKHVFSYSSRVLFMALSCLALAACFPPAETADRHARNSPKYPTPVMEFWTRNGITGYIECVIPVPDDYGRRAFTIHGSNDDYECENDNIRSVSLKNVKAGTRLFVFDNKSGQKTDSWAEINVLTRVRDIRLATFQRNYSDANVIVYYHIVGDDVLDGKISYMIIDVPCDYGHRGSPKDPQQPCR